MSHIIQTRGTEGIQTMNILLTWKMVIHISNWDLLLPVMWMLLQKSLKRVPDHFLIRTDIQAFLTSITAKKQKILTILNIILTMLMNMIPSLNI